MLPNSELRMGNDRWLSVEEIGVHLGVSKETVYRWLNKGKIPAHRVGRLWKFKTIEIDQWVVLGGANEFKYQEKKGSQ
jgi:excisionase family DNA binding protein